MKAKFIKREIETAVKEAAKYFPVITITGPRQSGKTTLIRLLFENLPYYSLENPDIRIFAANDPMAFLSQDTQGMVLDEVQNVPELLSYIQGMVDENPDKRFILSGSSQFSMLKSITQSLSGRTAIFELLPMSYNEVREQADKKAPDELLFDGFYPAIYAGKNIPAYLYPNYVKTYLERDVRDLLQIKDMMQFQTFLRLCAGRVGNLFNASELSNEVGISVNTVKSWLSVLQTSYVITILPPYFENTTKRLTKTPKLYFMDTGLACYLLGIENPQQLSRDRKRGDLFENFIVVEALKQCYNKGKESNLFFYRDSNQNEVDLLLKRGNHFDAIEIKSAQTYNPEFEKGLKVINKVFENRIENRTIVYAGVYENTVSDIKLINYKNMENFFY
ncbi:ATP-binding protein [Parabacteroides sp. PF5-6]|uniref:ATP-binding protein n=1 Tax=Parabacteroides sp. PF5-6 TaxID=1742403 RepID=UPI0024074169|nr:ATP-binding protein [Parabacteroides sp. PF5-6]MDF9831123.1 putative AAA+ superfamily ATPase [Parabacteroides sp. PF5-6]